MKFMDDKEAMFRRLAAEQLEPVNGLNKLLKWIEGRGLQRAAVTNAPRPNAELLLSMLGLADFFKTVVLASECDRVKHFPDAYLKALQILGASPQCTFVFEVRLISIIMCFGIRGGAMCNFQILFNSFGF
ncbi:haloacid dehalogenase-like hydrolase domain-containing protein Sgpp isoform X2 [Camellia sinensis]|uniref:haloacid dehalogenase-like hydrolase domain-containing protein Sgpp isoform X2 n=1 Tax=Camellia sinensis TaxID=4442 RepID=UPI0010369447|nr:haloacid dehalogenase-like hydrolase domain-containing protein Sgpp isoform X2 [Camellia sinensis]